MKIICSGNLGAENKIILKKSSLNLIELKQTYLFETLFLCSNLRHRYCFKESLSFISSIIARFEVCNTDHLDGPLSNLFC